ncbi:DUF323 domain-containing protein [Ephemerocybe angulata]|uniref:DUF323 domain-containing protein n=1 Tax=Ephemerocybe angulata TaxID=980116 RepID=A0A8H6HZF3_9AGAR|nr:DUF323 domain-containing protein [Tulosesus angulatus]
MPVEILDLHSLSNEGIPTFDMSRQIMDGLSRPTGEKNMPTMLLYDERGLRLYDDITTAAPEYYLFGAEEEILKNNADDIVEAVHRGKPLDTQEVVLELGAGALRKTSHMLLGLSRFAEKQKLSAPITYYALDLEKRELERTLGEIDSSDIGKLLAGKVATKGMCGTYDDGLKFLENGGLSEVLPTFADAFRGGSPISSGSSSDSSSAGDSPASSPTSERRHDGFEFKQVAPGTPPSPTSSHGEERTLHIMFLGSSIGNFPRAEAASFLRSLPLRAGEGDTLLLGLDHDNEKLKIEEAYNDKEGYTKKFIMNGLRVAGRTLGNERLFDEDKWEYVNRYNTVERRHEAYYRSKCAQVITDPTGDAQYEFAPNEELKVEESVKYSDVDAYTLFTNGNLRPVQRWTDSQRQYSLWLLERPPFMFPLLSSPSVVVPTDKDASSLVTSKASKASPFSIPSRTDWKSLWEAWDFVTQRMIPPSMLHEKPIDLRHICLFYLGHIPTFLDIHLTRLLEGAHTEPEEFKRGIDPDVDDPNQCHPHSEVPEKPEDWPSVSSILDFQLMNLYNDISNGRVQLSRKIARVLFMTLEHEAMHLETLLYMLIQKANGCRDGSNGTIPPPGFTIPHWDSLKVEWNCAAASPKNERVVLGPEKVVLGHDDIEAEDATKKGDAASVQGHEFGWDNESPKSVVKVDKFEISWRPVTNGEYYAYYQGEGKGKAERPASWVEDDGAMKVRTLYGPVEMEVAHNWPLIASYDSLSTYAQVKGGRLPTEPELRLFYDKFEAGYEGGSNVGFRNWHPVPATTGLDRGSGRGTNGGVWEWTSTLFDKTDGFVSSTLYPGYSSDFFDGKHQVVLGGSYATPPRIAGRRSFRNWYQRNYPYAWVGGRIVYDVPAEK